MSVLPRETDILITEHRTSGTSILVLTTLIWLAAGFHQISAYTRSRAETKILRVEPLV